MALSLAATYASSTTAAYASQAETVLRHADASRFSLGGTNLSAYARSIEVSITNGLEARRGAGTENPRAMQLVGAREVTVTVTDAETSFIDNCCPMARTRRRPTLSSLGLPADTVQPSQSMMA